MALTWTSQDTCKVRLNWQVGSIGFACNIFEMVMNQQTPHVVQNSDVVADVTGWMEAILTPMEPHVVVDCLVTGADFYKLVAGDWVFAGNAPVDFDPESIGDPLPSGVAALLFAATDQSKVRGRKFVPGLSELAQTASLWVVGVGAALYNSALAWILPFQSGETAGTSYWLPCVVNKSGVPVPFNGTFRVSTIPAYQRRRKEGVGA